MTYLSRSEAARRLNRCRKTMRNLEAQGLGPRTIKIGSRTVYPLADLAAYLADGGDR